MNQIVQRKVRAYTIIEVTVTMIIASISIAITYTAFNIIQQSYRDFNQRNNLIGELLVADKLLRKDFSEAVVINRAVDGISVIRDSGVINYSFTRDYILRKHYNIKTDTLFIRTADPVMTFEKRQTEDAGKVDKLSIQINMEGKSITLTYIKLYSSEDLYARNARAINLKF